MLTTFNALFCGTWGVAHGDGVIHRHCVPRIVTALTTFPVVPSLPCHGWGNIAMGEGGPGILQGLELGLVPPSTGGLGQQPLNIVNGFALSSCYPVAFFRFVLDFCFFSFSTATGACRFVWCFPAPRELRASACGARPRDPQCLPPDPAPGLLRVWLRASRSPLSVHCRPARLLPVSRPFVGPEPMCAVPRALGDGRFFPFQGGSRLPWQTLVF